MLRAIPAIVLTLLPTVAMPQHVCERTGQIVCPEGQKWNAETAKCEVPVSS